jgi:hypothetical protein
VSGKCVRIWRPRARSNRARHQDVPCAPRCRQRQELQPALIELVEAVTYWCLGTQRSRTMFNAMVLRVILAVIVMGAAIAAGAYWLAGGDREPVAEIAAPSTLPKPSAPAAPAPPPPKLVVGLPPITAPSAGMTSPEPAPQQATPSAQQGQPIQRPAAPSPPADAAKQLPSSVRF